MRGGADIETGALVLIGDEAALREFSAALRRDAVTAVTLAPPGERPALRPLQVLRVTAAPHDTTITISGDGATLNGNAASRQQLANEIDSFLEHNDLTEPGVHTHIDATTGPDDVGVLSEQSVDLVLAGPVSDEAQ